MAGIEAAKWWDNKETDTGNGLVAHTPDPTKYHQPDNKQDRTMRAGVSQGVVIPRATADGGSRGFDCSKAGMVHVDPDAPDGGVVVDLRKVNSDMLRDASNHGDGAAGVFYRLGKAAPGPRPVTKKASPTTEADSTPVNPLRPNDYVVPRSSADGRQLTKQAGDQPLSFDRSTPVSQVSLQPVSFAVHSVPQPAPSPQPASKPEAPQVMLDYQLLAAHLAPLLASQAQAVPASVPIKVPDDQLPAPRAGTVTSNVFAELDIPFVVGPLPQKPTQSVVFDLGPLGKASAKFHAVLENHNCVVLVYDTRYEEGNQYIPPERGDEPFDLHCPGMDKTFSICSMGLQFALGCFDFLVMIKSTAGRKD